MPHESPALPLPEAPRPATTPTPAVAVHPAVTGPLRRVAVLVVVGLLAVLAAGCSSGGSDDADPAAPTESVTATDPAAAPLATNATVRTVTGGRLPPKARTVLRDRVTARVDAWFEAAYLGGDYPRTDFDDAFEVFTPAARVRALEDRNLMSNKGVGTTTYAVRALARRVTIDALAVRGRVSAVTVKFRLGLARAGESGAERTERVSGHLYLTHTRADGWQVFGYDVQRGAI